MSRHHSRTQRSSAYAQARARGARIRPGCTREVAIDMEQEAARWRELAPRFGFCRGCGAIVDEDAGKLHDEQCMPGAPERCRKGQIT